MSDLNAPGMGDALDEDAAKLLAMGADPGPAFDHGSHMTDEEKHAALLAHPLYRLGWERGRDAGAKVLDDAAKADRDENGRWCDRRTNDTLEYFADTIRALKPETVQ